MSEIRVRTRVRPIEPVSPPIHVRTRSRPVSSPVIDPVATSAVVRPRTRMPAPAHPVIVAQDLPKYGDLSQPRWYITARHKDFTDLIVHTTQYHAPTAKAAAVLFTEKWPWYIVTHSDPL